MGMFEEENEYLKYTLKIIDLELKRAREELEKLQKRGTSLSYEDRQRGEHLNINAFAENVSNKIGSLTRSIPSPYFGRIDIKFLDSDNEEEKKLYIGKSGIFSDGESVVTDWRAPVSSLYYGEERGKTSYESPKGLIECEIELKRQINIKDSALVDVQDASIVTNDDLLRPYLSNNADNKMKIIIASIQNEQNKIIRFSPQNSIIVQGVAGSGKTSVALHRIAYLIYTLREKAKSNQFLVLGPNEYFLNYISSILPDLETSPVIQKTFYSFALNYINDKFLLKENNNDNLTDSSKSVSAFKSSLEYEYLLDSFMEKYKQDGILEDDFKIMDNIVFTKEELMSYLYSLSKTTPSFERLELLMKHNIKNSFDLIYGRIDEKYKNEYMKLPFGSEERRKLVKESSDFYNLLKNDSSKLIKAYLKSQKKSVLDIYKLFIENLNSINIPINDEELLLLKKETLEDLQKKKVSFEDIPSLLYIMYKLYNSKTDYKYLIIDEAQDYGLFHFDVLSKINKDANFAIYGDLAQAIYSYKSIASWEELNDKVFFGRCELLNLSKSYRTTIEITNNSNHILKQLGLNLAEPVIRHNNEILFIPESNNEKTLIKLIDSYKCKEYKTIAIICKTIKEAKKIYKILTDRNIEIKLISDKDKEYTGGLFVMTSADSKGLEFDAVIVNDASEEVYSSKSSIDMHLLYVACTRALHELAILYDKELTSVFDDKSSTDTNTKKLFLK